MKPIIFFDVETTGLNVSTDRILSLAFVKFDNFSENKATMDHAYLFNPGVPIPKEVSDLHGITGEMVKDKPTFKSAAAEIHATFTGSDLAGFNLANFDLPILWEELFRAGIEWNTDGVQVIDVGNIFKAMEERTLTAALKFYCGREHKGSHDAMVDVVATMDVLRAQLKKYPELVKLGRKGLAQFSAFDEKRFDLAGKFIFDAQGEVIYNFGNDKGKRVRDEPGLANWLLGKDFPEQTKMKVRALLNDPNQGKLL